MRVALGIALAALGSVANASGVRLGMTPVEVKAQAEDARDLKLIGMNPNYAMAMSESNRETYGFCRGRLVWLTQVLGRSLSDFVYHVKENTTRFGREPSYRVYQLRHSGGEQSILTATFPTSSGSVSVQHSLRERGDLSVSMIHSAYPESEAARYCK